jgi:hypothetical protein
VAVMAAAVAGGGAVVVVVKLTPHPSTSSPTPSPTPVVRPSPSPDPAPSPTPTPTPEPTGTSTGSDTPAGKDPGRAAALFKKADALRARQDVDSAIPLYLAALAADPSLAEAHKKLALCYQLKGDRRKAADRYRRYLATDPPDADRVRIILGTLE